MATTNIEVAENKGRVFDKICITLGWPRGGCQGLKRRAKFFSDGNPVIAKEDYADYGGTETGDMAFDYTNDHPWILTVAPTAEVDSTFVQMNA